MRPRRVEQGVRIGRVAVFALGGLSLAASAWGQTATPRPRLTVIIPSAPAQAPAPAPKLRSAQGPPRALAKGVAAGAPPPLPPVRLGPTRVAGRPIADRAACRTACAEQRYICSAAPLRGDDCDTDWSSCTVACGSSGYRRSPDLTVAPANSAYTPLRQK